MNIVVLSGHYYPSYSANSRCVGNIIEELENEYNITVISADSSGCNVDEEKYRNHLIKRVSTPTGIRRVKINKAIKTNKGLKKIFWRLILWMHKAFKVSRIIMSRHSIERELVNAYIEALNKIENIDIIIPMCNPMESIIAASDFKQKRANDVMIIPFLFDKFSVNKIRHRFTFNQKIKMRNHLNLEKFMIEMSSAIFVNETWQKHINKFFPQFSNKAILFEHPLLKELDQKVGCLPFDKGKINIVYAGGLNRTIRPPDYTLALFEKVILINSSVAVHFLAFGECMEIINKFSKMYDSRIVNHGRLPSKEASSICCGANLLLSIGNTDISQIPSKVFEYMAYGKPIIHLYHSVEDPVNKILSKYSLACCLHQNLNMLEENAKKLASFIEKNWNKSMSFSEVEKDFPEATPQYNARLLIKIISSLTNFQREGI